MFWLTNFVKINLKTLINDKYNAILNTISESNKEEILINDFDKINYWIELADYDLKTAKVMYKSKRYLYLGFMCNQVIEKILKAYYVKIHQDIPPFTHKLIKLAESCEVYEEFSDKQKDFIDFVSPLNVEARYPTRKDELFNSLSKERCRKLLKETEEMLIWIKKKLEN